MKRKRGFIFLIPVSMVILLFLGSIQVLKTYAEKNVDTAGENKTTDYFIQSETTISKTENEKAADKESVDKVTEAAALLSEKNAASEISETIEKSINEDVSEYIVETIYDKSITVENGIEFHRIAGDNWQGLMMVVKDAGRVFIGTPRDTYTGAAGMRVSAIAERYQAMLAVNGAFFVDTNQVGNGGTPIGFVFSNGEQKYGGNQRNRIIGLNQENKVVCGIMSAQEAKEAGIRDALTCNPILVENGQLGNLSTMNQNLQDARTAIGAREDGAFLILTIDGRMPHSMGATTKDEAEVMLAFGAVGAGNLDGGGSVGLYYTGTPLSDIAATLGTRPVPNAVCVKAEVK